MSFSLNPAQREAVRHVAGPLLVLAGAGSGKTRVITAKIAYLVAQGVAPEKILAITFTNKAAREMRERASALLSEAPRSDARAGVAPATRRGAKRQPAISTFHALGLQILRSEAQAVGLSPSFSVLGPGDLETLVAELIATVDRGRARSAQWRISQWKNALVAPAQALATADNDDDLRAAKAYANYGEALAAYQAVDFDDLIVRPVALFDADAEAAARWQAKYTHVLIDEYQDTNAVQYRLLRHLVGGATPFTAVGDDDQAIYGWRGATLDNLALLPRDYPDLKVVKLEQNYRSTVRILRCANALIGHNPKLYDKRLWSELPHGDTIRVAPAANEDAEAEMVVNRISALKFERRAKFSDFAVLYRGNHQARVFETALRALGMPYEVSGGQSYFDRVEIKDVVSYLRLIANDDDDPAFLRAVTTPKRGIGQTTLARLGELATTRHESLFAAVFAPDLAEFVPAKQREVLEQFCALINNMRHRAPREPAGRLLNELVGKIGYLESLNDSLDKREAEAKTKSVGDFVDWLARKGENDQRNLLELTQTIALITMLDGTDTNAPDTVQLSTLHAAKGLEFPHVFIVGVEEGILPHRESTEAGKIEEERRLMYVGITRAQQSLHLSYCLRRKRAGESASCAPSRFIGELAQEDLRFADQALPPDEAAREKSAGSARLSALKAMLAREAKT